MERIVDSNAPPHVTAAAAQVAQFLIERPRGAAYTYIARRARDGCPGAILLGLTGTPEELQRVLLAVDGATEGGR